MFERVRKRMTRKEKVILAVVEATRGIPVFCVVRAFDSDFGIVYSEMRFYLN